MAHIQYMPGDPRLVDQLVCELKSKGIFDQFRKDCIADVDTRPAYQNLRQRVENSVSTFLSRQTWQPDLNKNQLREKLRKHILDGNYLEQGVERIVDQVVNPKVATVFIPQVEDLVYNYLGITRKKSVTAETSNGNIDDLLPNDLEAVSPGSVKSNEGKDEAMEMDETNEDKMDIDEKSTDVNDTVTMEISQDVKEDVVFTNIDSNTIDQNIPLPSEEIKPENIPPPENSPPKIELETIELPKEPIASTDIPLPDDISRDDKEFFKPVNSEEDDSSSDSSLRRNMSPLTPIRNFNNENSCDAQQAFENNTAVKEDDKKEPSSFRFAIEAKSPEESPAIVKPENIDKKDNETTLAYQFNNQVNINSFNTPLYEDSSNSNILHIDYESDANSKVNQESKVEIDHNSEDSKKERKTEEKKSSSSSHKSSHRSRDSHKHSSSSRDKKSESKPSSSRDSSRHDKSKSSKDESKSKSSNKDKSRDKSDKKDSRDSSRHRSSHKSSHKDSKSHRSSSSSHRHSSKHSDEKKSSSSSSHKDKSSDKSSSDKRKDSKSNHRSDKDRKSSSSSSKSEKSSSKSKHDEKDKEKKKKETDDHYSVSGRGNRNRRSTDRDSNDGSSSSKSSNHPSNSKTSETKKESKSSSKSETSTSSDSTSPSDKENRVHDYESKTKECLQHKPIVRIESHLEQPISSPPRLPFVPDVTIKKPKFAANLEEAKRLMKMRKFLDEEQKRMNQEAALLLEFQANVRPSMSQVYSSIPGPELEFACVTNTSCSQDIVVQSNENLSHSIQDTVPHYTGNQLLNVLNDASVVVENNLLNKQNESENIAETETSLETSSETHDQTNTDHVSVNKDIILNENTHKEMTESYERKQIDENEKLSTVINNASITSGIEVINASERFEVTVIAEPLSESELSEINNFDSLEDNNNKENPLKFFESEFGDEKVLNYFAEHEKYNAEIERATFSRFYKEFNKKSLTNEKIYLINCNSYEENLIKDVSKNFGNFEIVSYHKNGHLTLPKTKNVIKNVNISNEIYLPIDGNYDRNDDISKPQIFSPEKSECSFELTSDYDAKLEEMVHKTSRQEIMEIILGNVGESPSKMPRIDYLTDSNIDDEYEYNMKRKIDDVEMTVNNNMNVLTPKKIRKLSTEQITSTTEETEEDSNNKVVGSTRSKYLGKARRVGLPRPKRTTLPNSPSSDKSVENYEQNAQTTPVTPNGKIKRAKVQRYDTSDLYKPKLHFLSRRNHIT